MSGTNGRKRPQKVGIPGPIASTLALALGGGVSAACAMFLDDEWGFYWLVGTAFAVVVVGFALFLDRGHLNDLSRERDPYGVQPFRARVLLLLLLAQVPAVGWRLYEGEPNARAAKHYVETILPELRSRVTADPVVAADTGMLAPDLAAGLPAAYPSNGLHFGTLAGDLWVEVETRGLLTARWRLDPTDGWLRIPRDASEKGNYLRMIRAILSPRRRHEPWSVRSPSLRQPCSDAFRRGRF